MSFETLYLELSSPGINSEKHSAVEILFDHLRQFADGLGLQTVILAQKAQPESKGGHDKTVKFVGLDSSKLFELDRALHELSIQYAPEDNPPVDERILATIYPDSPPPDDLALLPQDFLIEVEDGAKGGKYVRLIHGSRGVRVTHVPTGTSVECNAVDTSNKNDEAIRMLVARLVATHWAHTQPSLPLAIHEYVFPNDPLLQQHPNLFSRGGTRNAP